MKFVTNNIVEWFLEYQYTTKYPATAKSYYSQTNRYLNATSTYENYHSLFSLIANGKSLPEGVK